MKSLRSSGGFTIVEVVIVLAVTALLLTGVLAGRGTQREAARFSTSIDGIKSVLDEQQSEAQRTIEQPITTGSGIFGRSDSNVFGKIIEFNASTPLTSSMYTVHTLIIREDGQGGLNECDTQSFNLPNGVLYRGASDINGNLTGVIMQDIVFTKSPAQLYVTPSTSNAHSTALPPLPDCLRSNLYTNPAVPTTPPPPPPADSINYLNQSNYDPTLAPFTNPANLLFQENPPTGKKALIQVIPSSNTFDRKFF